MRKRKALYILIAVLILAVSVLTVSAIADAGNFSGGSDYGGGGWSGGGPSDWGGSSDWDDSGSSGGFFFFSGGGSGGSGDGSWVAVVVIIIVLYFVFSVVKRAKRNAPVRTYTSAPMNLQPLSGLLQKDPNFSEAAMREKISNLYVRMQNAWQDKDFEPMRPFMTDALYNQFARQLDELKRADRTNFVERIAVLDVTLNGWSQDEENDSLVATVSTRIVDYTVDDNSGKVISGSKTAEKFMVYEWTMIRSSSISTPERAGKGRDGTVEISCPSCGAPVEINQSAKCPYCGSIINAKDYDWSIAAIKGISQRTAGR